MKRWVAALLPLAVSASSAATERQADKKILFRAIKHVPFVRRVLTSPLSPVTLYNLRTREAVPVIDGSMPTQADWSRLVRCHFTGNTAWVSERLVAEVVTVARKLGALRVEIISGYRDPKYNRWLRKKGREVARSSRHTRGQAVDFRLRGVPVRELRDWLLRRQAWGVGYYPKSGFVHIDVGPVRRWTGR